MLSISDTRSSRAMVAQSSLQANLFCSNSSVIKATQPVENALIHSKLAQVSLLFTAVCDEGISYVREPLTQKQKRMLHYFIF